MKAAVVLAALLVSGAAQAQTARELRGLDGSSDRLRAEARCAALFDVLEPAESDPAQTARLAALSAEFRNRVVNFDGEARFGSWFAEARRDWITRSDTAQGRLDLGRALQACTDASSAAPEGGTQLRLR